MGNTSRGNKMSHKDLYEFESNWSSEHLNALHVHRQEYVPLDRFFPVHLIPTSQDESMLGPGTNFSNDRRPKKSVNDGGIILAKKDTKRTFRPRTDTPVASFGGMRVNLFAE